MSARTHAAALFLTAPPQLARAILEDVLERFPEHQWTVYFRATHREDLGPAIETVEAISDKPTETKTKFLRAIRSRRYAMAVMAWTRHQDYDRMKLVGLLSGARNHLVYNENLESFYLDARDLAMPRRGSWRLSILRGLTLQALSTGQRAYKWTLGLLIGSGRLTFCHFLWRVRRRRHLAAHHVVVARD